MRETFLDVSKKGISIKRRNTRSLTMTIPVMTVKTIMTMSIITRCTIRNGNSVTT